MVECGSIDQPPSIEHVTIWGVVTFVIMLVLGLSSVGGVLEVLNSDELSLWSFILLAGSGFGVAGLVLVILSLVKKNSLYMKMGIFCFLVSCIINIVLIILAVFGVSDSKLYISSILHIALDIFLCYLFYRQSSGFSPSIPSTQSSPST